MKELLKRLWGGKGAGASTDEVTELTNQFYVTLRAYFAKVQQDLPANHPARSTAAYARIEKILEIGAVQRWTDAYEAEQMLVHLFGDSAIATELLVRTMEAKAVLRPELAAAYAAQLDEIATQRAAVPPADAAAAAALDDRRRTILSRLVNDLQWRYIVNEATRKYSKLVTRRTAILSSTALVAFVAVIWVIYRDSPFTPGDPRLLGVAGLAGLWGATFSMLATMKARLGASTFEDLKVMKAFPVLVSRALVGASAACILFFFLTSGLLGGTAFPRIGEELADATQRPAPSPDAEAAPAPPPA